MSTSRCRGSGRTPVACVLVAGLLFAPAIASATEKASPGSATPLRLSVERLAAKESHRLIKDTSDKSLKGVPQQAGTQSPDPKLQSGSFFRTPAGVAVLAAFGAGLGYALYSSTNDRIRSSGR
jgi:hypothetical protein